jgi:hypothetical protein
MRKLKILTILALLMPALGQAANDLDELNEFDRKYRNSNYYLGHVLKRGESPSLILSNRFLEGRHPLMNTGVVPESADDMLDLAFALDCNRQNQAVRLRGNVVEMTMDYSSWINQSNFHAMVADGISDTRDYSERARDENMFHQLVDVLYDVFIELAELHNALAQVKAHYCAFNVMGE